jgi:N-acetylglutamate synthase-like GNAT family acetyltransferase
VKSELESGQSSNRAVGGMIIRPALETDQTIINQIVRDAQINPMNLDWHRFLVAEENGKIIGVGQIKPHDDGSRELASIAVIPGRQKLGVATEIIRALLAPEKGDLYLVCRDELESFYARFGFRTVDRKEMTPYFRRIIRVIHIFACVAGRRGIVMKRDGVGKHSVQAE